MNTLDLKQHDPLDRQLEGEPHFALMGRDALAAPFVRLYAAVVEGRYDRANGLLTRILDVAKSRAQRPHKDTDHAWSARRVADEMEQWFTLHMKGEQPKQRVNGALDPGTDLESDGTLGPRDAGAFAHDLRVTAIKAARPPAEPDEAS